MKIKTILFKVDIKIEDIDKNKIDIEKQKKLIAKQILKIWNVAGINY